MARGPHRCFGRTVFPEDCRRQGSDIRGRSLQTYTGSPTRSGSISWSATPLRTHGGHQNVAQKFSSVRAPWDAGRWCGRSGHPMSFTEAPRWLALRETPTSRRLNFSREESADMCLLHGLIPRAIRLDDLDATIIALKQTRLKKCNARLEFLVFQCKPPSPVIGTPVGIYGPCSTVVPPASWNARCRQTRQ